ncbi:MAG: ThiF family adenylyltransferase [Planctomycetes bacterium]|nr:ThiF family adenylyltransferase [Planctomycetota bacterium]
MNSTAPLSVAAGRFDRQERIAGWDQSVLSAAKVLVVGAGALGNEILKNLTLLGVGKIFVADMDTIEFSNLSRTVLFRESDLGKSKAETAARAAHDIYPAGEIRAFVGNVVYDLGLGVFDWADIVLCGLDNREARLEVNRNCWKTNTPWIDGAIEALNGQMRMFVPPDGACYECTMSKVDWQLLAARRSCTLLSRSQMEAGRVPTISTVSSIIAGLECHEAVKWLHGMSQMNGEGIVFNGLQNEFYPVTYQRKDECYSHETLAELHPLGRSTAEMTVGELLKCADDALGTGSVIELNRDVLRELECPDCGNREELLTSLGRVPEDRTHCPNCETLRIPHVLNQLDGECGLLQRTVADVGVPPFDILTARNGSEEIAFLFDKDAKTVLGELADDD